MNKITQSIFVVNAQQVHANRYDYTRAIYVNNKTKVEIICPIHGSFWQTPKHHIDSKSGCPACSGKLKYTTGTCIEKFRTIHASRYDYSLVDYVNNETPVSIICLDHGEFLQTPSSHFRGNGCPACYGNRKMTTEEFVRRSREIHDSDLDYSKTVYRSAHKKVLIGCSKHGDFSVRASHHLSGVGCPVCNGGRKYSYDEVIARARLVHGKTYGYQDQSYHGVKEPIEVICPEHGPFKQVVEVHLNGSGCPRCARLISIPENRLVEFFRHHDLEVITNSRAIIDPYELDIFVPACNLAIEYCGLVWHSERFRRDPKKYHWEKLSRCNDLGIRLVTIFEDEWLTRETVVRNRLLNFIGKSQRGPGARNIEIRPVASKQANAFCELHHLQGQARRANVSLGGFLDSELIGVMQFGPPSRQHTNGVELVRYCTDGAVYPGLSSRLFTHYVREHEINRRIVSFADLRWSSGNLYRELGFVLERVLPPDYSYVRDKRRFHKSNFRKSFISKRFGLPSDLDGKTEWETMYELGYYRIWDCGKQRWVFSL